LVFTQVDWFLPQNINTAGTAYNQPVQQCIGGKLQIICNHAATPTMAAAARVQQVDSKLLQQLAGTKYHTWCY